MAAYTERVVRVYAALLMEVFDEYRMSYVPHDIVAFVRELGMAMEVALCSQANIRKV